MKKSLAAMATLALVLAACGDAATSDTTDVSPAQTNPPVVEPTTTTTTVAETTTTVAPTTTPAPVLEASGGPQLRRIQAAMAQSSEVQSARMNGEITIYSPNDFDGDVSFVYSAAFNQRTGDSSFSIDLTSMADFMQAEIQADTGDTQGDQIGAAFAQIFLSMLTKFEVRQIGDTVYINNPGYVALSGSETEWIAGPAEPGHGAAGDFLQGSPLSPAEVLDPLQTGEGSVEEIGKETVRGVETTHYRVTYSKESLLAAAEKSQFAEDLTAVGDEVIVDVWMDDSNLYKLVFDIDGSGISDPEVDSFERTLMVFEIYDYDADIVIETPPADQVTYSDAVGSFSFGFGDD